MSDDTLPRLPSNTTDEGGPAGDETILVIAYSEHEPERMGESFAFRELGVAHGFGRGPGEPNEPRVEPAPYRPGEPVQGLGMRSEFISRRQMEFTALTIGVDVKLVGSGELYVAGERTDHGVVAFGQTIRLDKRLLLYVTRRQSGFRPRYLLPAARGCSFGEPDRFKITGESVELYRMLDAAAFAAQSGQHALLRGETGTGKELVARVVHALSERARRPFVAHNAAAMPAGLLDAEIFGHAAGYPEKGMPERLGLVGEAGDGTLFLDEIGEMSHDFQSHLLRLLDAGGQYRRAGDPRPHRTDLRMIGATNRSLEEGLKHDLIPRLKRHVELPPLRARMEDVPLLARAYARLLMAEGSPLIARFVEERPDGTRDVRVGIDFIEALLSCDHPTNVRGIEKAVLDSMMLSPGRTLRPFPELLARTPRSHESQGASPYVTPGGRVKLTPELEAKVRSMLASGKHGAIAEAARALGLSRHQVERVRDRLGTEHGASGDEDTP
jgi:two-component system nitrogen regulation response regulator GlnG/two-component system response regulator HydG